MAFRGKYAHQAYNHALQQGAEPIEITTGPIEVRLKSINGIGGATVNLHIGDQLTRQDAETGGGKKSGKKKGKTKTINKSNLPDKTIRGFYFNVALLFRLTVEQRRRKGRLRSIRTTAYQEIVGLTGI